MTDNRPLCLIFTPFDHAFETVLAPAAQDAGLAPLRASDKMTKPAGEQFVLSAFAIADMTRAEADTELFYYLGVRDAVRPGKTVVVREAGRPEAREAVAVALREAQTGPPRRSVFDLVESATDHTKTDVFRENVSYDTHWKQELARGRKEGADDVRAIEREIGDLTKTEAGVLVDLLLSYRAVSAWTDMITLAAELPPAIAQTAMVQEQLAFALNRLKQREQAEAILRNLMAQRGANSETCALLGRIYKDRWDEALKAGSPKASDYLEQSIAAYLAGFEADWRDAYPGVNAVTLMELKEPPDERRAGLLPVVRYAVERKIAQGPSDYWDFATLVELAVLAEDRAEAEKMLSEALARVREKWEPETTLRNLRLIRETRQRRGKPVEWAEGIEKQLSQAG